MSFFWAKFFSTWKLRKLQQNRFRDKTAFIATKQHKLRQQLNFSTSKISPYLKFLHMKNFLHIRDKYQIWRKKRQFCDFSSFSFNHIMFHKGCTVQKYLPPLQLWDHSCWLKAPPSKNHTFSLKHSQVSHVVNGRVFALLKSPYYSKGIGFG